MLQHFTADDNNDSARRLIPNPFYETVVAAAELEVTIHNQLIKLPADKILQVEFSSEEMDKFWSAQRIEYPEFITEALKTLIPFATSHLCEIEFSSMAAMKTK
jgi:hypothetical protein